MKFPDFVPSYLLQKAGRSPQNPRLRAFGMFPISEFRSSLGVPHLFRFLSEGWGFFLLHLLAPARSVLARAPASTLTLGGCRVHNPPREGSL